MDPETIELLEDHGGASLQLRSPRCEPGSHLITVEVAKTTATSPSSVVGRGDGVGLVKAR